MLRDLRFVGVGAVGIVMTLGVIAAGDAPHALTDFFSACPGATCQRPLPTVIVPASHAAVSDEPIGHHAACINPTASVIQTVGHTWEWSSKAAELTSIEDCLTAWQRSTSEAQTLTDRDTKWLTRTQQGRLSPHACELAARLLGPVDAARLRTDFEWLIEEQSPAAIVLVGTPLDDVTRMFTREILISLDARGGTLRTLALRDREGSWCSVERPAPRSTITLAVAVRAAQEEDDLPPSPTLPNSSEVRFANDAIEFEVQLRR